MSEPKENGYSMMKKYADEYFAKWGLYMKRAGIAERKIEKLKQLLLLTDPAVSSFEMNQLSALQWSEFIKAFPDENPTPKVEQDR